MENNIWEIQDLYKDEENKVESRKERVEEEEVILIRPYKILELTSSTTRSSFINDEVDNLMKYMKFVRSPTQTRLFKYHPIISHFDLEENKIQSFGKKWQLHWWMKSITLRHQEMNTQ